MTLKFLGDYTIRSSGCSVCGARKTNKKVLSDHKCYYTMEGRICFVKNRPKEVSDEVGEFLLGFNEEMKVFEKC